RAARLRVQGPQQRPATPGLDEQGGAVLRGGRHPGAGPPRPGAGEVRPGRALPHSLHRRREALGAGRRRGRLGPGARAVASARPDEHGVRRLAPARPPSSAQRLSPMNGQTAQTAQIGEEVVARLWRALAEIDDPEIPVSLVDMGLIVAVDYEAETQTARLQI